jgi:hypothetical protein
MDADPGQPPGKALAGRPRTLAGPVGRGCYPFASPPFFLEGVASVTETIQVGAQVPDFNLTTYEPTSGDFGEISLADLKSSGKWTILFFYPADFTFV